MGDNKVIPFDSIDYKKNTPLQPIDESAGSEDIKRKKQETRNIILFKRREMSIDEWEKGSAIILNKILGHCWYRDAKHVLVYINRDNEPSTRGIILHALSNGKKVYAPVVDPEGYGMEFYRIDRPAELKPGGFGIPEPPVSEDRLFIPGDEKGIMIVPGTAFDSMGHRLGTGRAYYDNYLKRIVDTPIRTIAPIFHFQFCEYVPTEPHDRTIECLVTEKGIIQTVV